MVLARPVHELLEVLIAGLGRWLGRSVGCGDFISPVVWALVPLMPFVPLALAAALAPIFFGAACSLPVITGGSSLAEDGADRVLAIGKLGGYV